MKNKRFLCILLIIAIVFSVAACNAGSGTNNGPGSSAVPSSSPKPEPSPSPSSAPSPSPPPSENPSSAPNPSPSAVPSPSQAPSPSSPSGGGDSGLSGEPGEILKKLLDDLVAAGAQMPMAMPPMEVPAAESQYTIGLSEADFNKYVVAAAQSKAAIGSQAHEILLIQGADAKAAEQIKKLVSGNGGYDANKWICVHPEVAIVIDAGSYVLLVASSRETADLAVEVLKAAAGSIGSVDTFWNHAG